MGILFPPPEEVFWVLAVMCDVKTFSRREGWVGSCTRIKQKFAAASGFATIVEKRLRTPPSGVFTFARPPAAILGALVSAPPVADSDQRHLLLAVPARSGSARW